MVSPTYPIVFYICYLLKDSNQILVHLRYFTTTSDLRKRTMSSGYTPATNAFGGAATQSVFGNPSFSNLSNFGASPTQATQGNASLPSATDSKTQCAKGLFSYRLNDVHVFKFPGPYQLRLEAVDRHLSRLYITDANGNETNMLDNVKLNLLSTNTGIEGVQQSPTGKCVTTMKCVGNSYIINAYDDYEVLVDGKEAVSLNSVIQHRFVTTNGVTCSRLAM